MCCVCGLFGPSMGLTPYGAAAGSVQIRSMRICRSPQSLTYVSSWGLSHLSPSCNSNYLEYKYCVLILRLCAWGNLNCERIHK
ncbi:hypothetical protein B8042_11610 [Escherichia coli]|uniref:Uncharacterized protein n=2 Tax=Enterobacteriaceae TaxID=543 RepID=A0A2J7LAI0_ECOLX|nr:hypothetical protein BSZ13_15415 [Escherichia coli]OYE46664.1 hypothetical protein CI633_23760 [Shigella sonnei]OYK76006.1 hypothetical protein CI719_10050 [Shigella boydii]AQV51140.1 hypothetical protein BE949_07915 [Escherichia coli]ARW88472.1 hypothetical protein AM396_17185 [Escherichia coli]